MKKIIIYAVIALILYHFISKYLKRRKYENFFHDLGFSRLYLKKFTTQQLFDSWNYINNYVRKGIELTPRVDPILYERVKAINNQFNIFTNLK